MEIDVSYEKGRVPVTVFYIRGEIDVETADKLQAQARQAIEGGTRHLLLDMSKVSYLGSYGIRALNDIFSWLQDRSPDTGDMDVSAGIRDGTFKSPYLKLLKPAEHVSKVLTTTGVDMFLEVHKNLSHAVQSF